MTRRHPEQSQRQRRVGEEVRHALADVLLREPLYDPLLSAGTVTVTEVRMSPDLRHATVYVLPFGDAEAAPLTAALTRVAPRLRALVGRRVRLKFTPELRFAADETFAHAARIEALLREKAGGGA